MHSIRTKITLMTLTAIVVSVLAVGGIGIYSIKSEGDRNAAREMRLVCDSQRKSLNEYLYSIEQSVNMVSRYVTQDLNVVNLVSGGAAGALEDEPSDRTSSQTMPLNMAGSTRQRRMDIYLDAHSRRAQTVFASVANHTNGVVSYYYRFNPALSSTELGFWYTSKGSSSFIEAESVDISAYDASDMGHVGWYTLAQQRGRPSWLEPYRNETLGLDIVSYVTPIYKAGTFIGVVGMDILWETLVDQIRDIRVYDTGYACLIDQEGLMLYHPTLPAGTSFMDMDIQLLSDVNSSKDTDDISLFAFSADGTAKRAASTRLDNDLSLLIIAPEREISAGWRKAVNGIIVAAAAILGIFAIVATAVMKHITDPLRNLAAASTRLAEGEYDMKLEYEGDDEVGVLTQSFNRMADHLNTYIKDLNSKAYKDALTGIRNKQAFNIFADKLNEQIQAGTPDDPPQFGIVMLDCNELKEINDAFGHDKGDIYLQTSSRIICGVFTHSPVFRIGGDEFVAVLQNGDYENRENLMQTFNNRAAEINTFARNPWDRISLAKGLAIYDSQRDADVDSVLHRADELMYVDKKRMKQHRGYSA